MVLGIALANLPFGALADRWPIRPILLTAAAVIVGSLVMLADPIFQGLAVSLMAGEVAATLLSRLAVPVLYFLLARRGRAADLQRSALHPEVIQ